MKESKGSDFVWGVLWAIGVMVVFVCLFDYPYRGLR